MECSHEDTYWQHSTWLEWMTLRDAVSVRVSPGGSAIISLPAWPILSTVNPDVGLQ
jgi:hypothetical protein